MICKAVFRGMRAGAFWGLLLGLPGLACPGAEENRWRASLGVEGNMATAFDGLALGRSISVEAQFFKHISNGIAFTMSDDFAEKTAIETELYARWNFLTFRSGVFKASSFFLQGGAGMSLLLQKGDSEPRILAGLALGFRYFFKDKDYFIEPFVKGGYPFIVGFGIKTGCRL